MKQFRFLANFLLPRPLDFFGKAPIFFAGWLIALGEWQPAALQRSPDMAALSFVLAWFLIQEGVIQQAKYMWNDWRDFGRDQLIPANRRRFLARHKPSQSLLLALALRWAGGLLLAYWLSWRLFLLAIAITLLQMVYEWGAKPRAATIPLAPLAVVAAGSLLRFLGGVWAAGGPTADPRLWLYFLLFLAVGAAYGTVLWTSEAHYLHQRQLPWLRGQSHYFFRHGAAWLSASSRCAAVICALLLLHAYRLHPFWPPSLKLITVLVTTITLTFLFRFYGRVAYETFVLLHRHDNLSLAEKPVPTSILKS